MQFFFLGSFFISEALGQSSKEQEFQTGNPVLWPQLCISFHIYKMGIRIVPTLEITVSIKALRIVPDT